jgi:uncharacterized cupredoxin-like copper-binding protein
MQRPLYQKTALPYAWWPTACGSTISTKSKRKGCVLTAIIIRCYTTPAYYTFNRIPDGDKLDVPRRKIAPAMAGRTCTAGYTPRPSRRQRRANRPARWRPAKGIPAKPADWSAVDQTITIGTLPGLKYNRTFVTLKTGSRIKWTLSNNDDMPHNLVIVKPGAADAVGAAAPIWGLKGQEMWYIPKSPDVLFHTKLTQPGASDSIYFVAPAPGDYTFVCTVPGHAQVDAGPVADHTVNKPAGIAVRLL